jgi:hypothetical protein
VPWMWSTAGPAKKASWWFDHDRCVRSTKKWLLSTTLLVVRPRQVCAKHQEAVPLTERVARPPDSWRHEKK